MFDVNTEPVLFNIAESFEKFQWKFWELNENFLMALLVDNKIFKGCTGKEGPCARMCGSEPSGSGLLREKQGITAILTNELFS
jgi:hypothetical protein